jgi:hypothetical protein
MFKCFFGFGVFPTQNMQIDSHGEGDNKGCFIQGDKQRQCTYNIILKGILATIVEEEKKLHFMYLKTRRI